MKAVSPSGGRRRLAWRIAGVAFLVCLAVTVCLTCFGFPDWLTRKCLSVYKSPLYSLEVERVAFRPGHGLKLTNVRLHRRQTIGPPVVQAAELSVDMGWGTLLGRGGGIERVMIRGGVLRPMLMGRGGRKAQPSPEDAGARHPVSFSVRLEECIVSGVRVDDLEAEVLIRAPWVRISGVRGNLSQGAMHGSLDGSFDFDADAKELRGRFSGKLDPHLLLPFFREAGLHVPVAIINDFAFHSKRPEVDVDFTQQCIPGGALNARAAIALEDMAFRDVNVERGNGTLMLACSATNTIVKLSPLLVVRPEGAASVSFTVESAAQRVVFDGISTLHPRALFDLIGLDTGEVLTSFTFEGPVTVAARGVVDYGPNLDATDFAATVEGRDVRFMRVKADHLACRVRMEGATNTISEFAASLYGGALQGEGWFALSTNMPHGVPYGVSARMREVDVQALARDCAFGKTADYSGMLGGRLQLTGVGGWGYGYSARGEGSVAVGGGRVFLMPLFGGLTTIMTRVIPGVDFVLRQTDAKAEFSIGDGKVHSDALYVRGGVLSLSMDGDFYFTGDVDANAQVRLLRDHTLAAKVLRIVTYPLSKLFEFRVRGPIASPRWYPVNFSKDLLEKLGMAEPAREPK